jgi:hypothetical protein
MDPECREIKCLKRSFSFQVFGGTPQRSKRKKKIIYVRMSSAAPDVQVETGSHSDLKVWDINSMAEPIMRVWQLSEALSRMAKRVQKRYPEDAKILRASSEDIVHYFFLDMRERQAEFLKNARANEDLASKEQEETRRKAGLKQTEQTNTGSPGQNNMSGPPQQSDMM